MKWTKFKDDIPKSPTIYITDFKKTWLCNLTLYDRTHLERHWEEYSKIRSEDAWAEIELPEVPKEEKKLHKCIYEVDRNIFCLQEISANNCKNLWVVYRDEYQFKVNFCPFCGYSPK